MKIATDEIFGPVMSVFKFKDTQEVIKRANNTRYGLAAGVVTKSIDNAITVSNALRAGSMWVNCYYMSTQSTPFGGFKDSGIGREKGLSGIEIYQETKSVIIKRPEEALP